MLLNPSQVLELNTDEQIDTQRQKRTDERDEDTSR